MASASAMYRAIRVARFGAPSVMEIGEVAIPTPSAKQVLINIKCAGINPVDTYLRTGKYTMVPPLPYTPGNDGAGIVTAVGDAVSKVKVGDRAICVRSLNGTYAEYALCDERFVFPLPDTLSFAEGAAVPVPFFTAYRALFHKLRIRPGKTVLVHGATGAVGSAACQMAHAHGCRVIGTAGSEAGAANIRPYCDEVIPHVTLETAADVKARMTAAYGGIDYIVEMLANVNLATDMKIAKAGGAICVIGSRGDVSISPRDFMTFEITVTGVTLFASTDDEMDEGAAYVSAGLRSGVFKPIVGRVFEGLDQAAATHEEVIRHEGGTQGKIVLQIS